MDQRFDHLVKLLQTSPDHAPPLVEIEAVLAEAHRAGEPNRAAVARSELSRIYRERGDDVALAELFEKDALRAETSAGAADLYFELAETLHEMGHPLKAVAMWQRALRLEPGHRDSLRRIRETHLGMGRLEAARALADREVELFPDDADPTIYVELGQLALEHPPLYPFARACAEEALKMDPAAPGGRGILDTLDALAGTWHEEARKLRSRAADEKDRQVAARLYLKIAGLHAAFDEGEGREDRIAEALRRTFLLSPALPEGLEFLERRHGEREDFEGLARAWESLVETATESGPQVDILLRLANLYEIRFDDRSRAIESLARAATLDASRPDVIGPLVEKLEEEGRLQEAAHHLERHLATSPTAKNQRSLRLQLADLYVGIHRPDRARSHFQALLELDPGNQKAEAFLAPILAKEERARPLVDRLRVDPSDEGAIEELEELLADPALAVFAAEALEKAYEKARDWPSLKHVLEIRIEASTDPAFRLRELRRLSLLAGRELRDPALACTALLQAFREAPGDALLRSELRVAAGQASMLPALAETMAEVAAELAATGSQSLAVTVERELAELYEKRLEDPAAAAACHRRIRDLDPRNVEALRALHRLDRQLGAFEELRVICLTLSALVFDKVERQRLWREAADVALEELADRELAVEPLSHLAEVDDDAAARLERLLEGLERWEEQAQILQRLLEKKPDPEGERRLALLLRDRLGNPGAALQILTRQLPHEPQARSILGGWAVGIARGASEAAVALDTVLESLGEHEERLSLWEKRLEHAASPEERLALHRKILAITERDLGRVESAFLRACRAFPAFPSLHDELERLAAASGSFAELIGAYEDAATAGAFEWRRRIAEIHEEKLGDLPAAIEAWKAVLLREADDLHALDALARLLGNEGRVDEQIEILEKRARATVEPSDERRSWIAAADLAAGSDRQRAAVLYRRALSVDPDHLPALEGLSRVLDEAKDREELLSVLDRLAAAGATGDPLEQKERLLGAAGRWDELIRLLEERLASDPTPERRVRLAALRLEKEGDAEGACALYRENLEAEAGHPGTVEALEAWALSDRSDRALAANLLLPHHEATDDVSGQVRLLEVLASTAEGKEKAALFVRISEAYAGSLASPELAFLSAGRALEADPDDASILERALRTAEAAELVEELVAILGVVADTATTGRLDLLRTRARLLGPGEPAARRQAWERVRTLAPDDREALEQLVTSYEAEGDAPAQLEILQRLLDGEEDPAWRRSLLLSIAGLQEAKLGDSTGALSTWRQILEIAPDDPAALEAIDRLCTTLERWVDLPGILESRARLAKATGDLEGWSGLLLRLAELRETRLFDREGAVELWGKILEARPDHGAARERLQLQLDTHPGDFTVLAILETSFSTTGEYAALAEILDARVSATDEPGARKAVLIELAALRGERLGRPDLAFLTYSRAFREEAHDPYLWDALFSTAKAADHLDEWLALWEDAWEKGTWNRAAALHVAPLCEREVGDEEAALRWYERARTDEDPVVLTSLERLYRQQGRWGDLADVLEALATLEENSSEKLSLLFRLGGLAEEKLKDPPRAMAAWEAILAMDPDNLPAIRSLEAHYEREGRGEDLARLWQKRLLLTRDPRESLILKERIGEALASSDPDRAIESYEAVLEREPRHRRALEALSELYQRRGDGPSLVATLRRLLPLQDDATGVKAIRLQLAEALHRLGQVEEAREEARRVLDLEPHDRVQLQRVELLFREMESLPEVARTMELQAGLVEATEPELALDLWRGIASLWSTELERPERAAPAWEKVLAHGRDAEAFDALCAIYREAEDWRKYAALVESWAAGVEGGERARLLRELAPILEEKLGQKEIAFVRLGTAFELLPSDEALRADLWRLADEVGMHEELALIVESVAEGEAPGPVAIELFLALGVLHELHLADPEEAENAYRKALEIDPVEPRALDALAALFEKGGNGRSLALVLERQLEATADLEGKRQLLHRISAVYEGLLGDANEAVASLERASELDPTSTPTFDALASLYERSGRPGDLASLLERRRELVSEPEERRDLQLRLADLLEVALDDDPGAIAALSLALEYDPASTRALDALERLYSRHGHWAELLRVYDRKLDLVRDPSEKARLLVKAAGIWEENFQHEPNAVACLEGALSYESGDLAILRELGRLLRATKSWARLVQVLEHHESLLDGGDEKIDLHIRLGDVLYKELGQTDAAEAAYRRALALDPSARGALSALGRLYERSGNWPFALEMLAAEAALVRTGKEAVELHHRIGSIHREMLLDGASAQLAYEQALALDPSHLPTLRAMQQLQQSRGDATGYLEALRAEAEHTRDPSAKTGLYNRIGHFLLEQGADPEEAIRAFEQARRHTQDDREAARALSDLYVARESWAEAEEVLDIVCAALSRAGADGQQELAERTYRLGAVAEKLGKQAKALQSFARAWEIDPGFLSAGEGLARLLVASGDHARALRTYQALLIHHRDRFSDPEVVELHWIIGDLRHKLGDADAALKSFANGLELDPWHVDSHRSIIAVAEGVGRLDLSFSHRSRLLEILEGEERLEFLLDTAAMAREKLADPWQAIDCYHNARKIRPDDPRILEKLVELYRETRQPARAVELLERLLGLAGEDDTDRVIRFHALLGEIFSAEATRDPAAALSAVEHFNHVLDRDWRRTDAFASLEKLLASRRDWRGLEANYVRMLQRMPKEEGNKQARILLYRSLGELYLNALQDPAAAAEAFQAVTVLAPDDGPALLALARHRSEAKGGEADAIATWRRALPHLDELFEAARHLEKLHVRNRDYDGAWVAASVVTGLLEKGGTDEAGIIEKLSRFARTSATGTLSDELFRGGLCHEGVRGNVAMLLGLVWTHAGSAFASSFDELVVDGRSIRIDRRRQRVSLDEGLFFVHAYNLMASALACTPPELYRVPGVKGVHLVNTWPLCVVAGEEMFTDARSKRELYHAIGSQLVYARSRLTMASMDEASLLPIFEAALALGDPHFQPTAEREAVARARKRLEQALPVQVLPVLQKIARSYGRERMDGDLRRYREAARLTSARAGMLLCGDMAVARKASGPAAVDDLVRFGLSEAFAELRAALGLSVTVQG